MPVNSKRKGKRGELEAVKLLKRLGYPNTRRSQQYAGYTGTADLICENLPGIHIEVKFGYPLSKMDLGTAAWEEAVRQCGRDSGEGTWILLWKPKGHRFWRATVESWCGRATFVGDWGVRGAIEMATEQRRQQ